MLKNKFIIIVPVHNAKHLIEKCLTSLLSQDFDDLGIIIRDDISVDGTDEVISDLLGAPNNFNHLKCEGKDVIYIKNHKKLYPVGNTYESVMQYVDNPNAIIGVVDGDDMLLSKFAVKNIFDVYEKQPDKWMVWSQHSTTDGGAGQSKPIPANAEIYGGRNYWSVSHFRTNRVQLFHKLRQEDLMDPFEEKTYYTFAGDAAFLFPFCEMCGEEHSFFLDEVLYQYNNSLPTNEHNKNLNNAIQYGNHIRVKGKKYSKLSDLSL